MDQPTLISTLHSALARAGPTARLSGLARAAAHVEPALLSRLLRVRLPSDLLREVTMHFGDPVATKPLLEALRGDLPSHRRAAVTALYEDLQRASDGAGLQAAQVAQMYDPTRHPETLTSGGRTAGEIKAEFYDTFEIGSADGTVALADFCEYYATVGAGVDDADFFAALRACWGVPRSEPPPPPPPPPPARAFAAHDAHPEDTGARVRAHVAALGEHGVLALVRQCRGHGGPLTCAQFVDAVRQTEAPVAPVELRALFAHLAGGEHGGLDPERAVRALRAPLSPARAAVVAAVFAGLAGDAAAVVDPSEVAAVYDAAAHPDVAAGARTEEAVYHAFLDTFEVGSRADGKVSLDEFGEYCANVGSVVESDAAFEALLRAVWRTGHHHAAPAGPVAGLSLGALAQVASPTRPARSHAAAAAAAPAAAAAAAASPTGLSAVMGTGVDGSRHRRHGHLDAGVAALLARLSKTLVARGIRAVVGLERALTSEECAGGAHVSLAALARALEELALGLDDHDARAVLTHFDARGRHALDARDLLAVVRPPLAGARLALASAVWAQLAPGGARTADPEDLAAAFDASGHPDVAAGRRTADAVKREFLETFVPDGADGSVSKAAFLGYYAGVAACSPDAAYFDLTLKRVWGLGSAAALAAAAAAGPERQRVVVALGDGTTLTEPVPVEWGVPRLESAADLKAWKRTLLARFRQAGVRADDVLRVDDGAAPFLEKLPHATSKRGAPCPASKGQAGGGKSQALRASGYIGGCSGEANATSLPTASNATSGKPTGRRAKITPIVHPDRALPTAEEHHVLRIVAEALRARGVRGFHGLGRALRAADALDSKTLPLLAFRKCLLKDASLPLRDSEVRVLFARFGGGHAAGAKYGDFLAAVRAPPSPARAAAVAAAFAHVARGQAAVDPSEVAAMYDAAAHPDVGNGTRTAAECFRAFLDTFEVGSRHDGKVSLDEFGEYCANVGSVVDGDAAFEALLRAVWGMDGGAPAVAASKPPPSPFQPKTLDALRVAAAEAPPPPPPAPSPFDSPPRAPPPARGSPAVYSPSLAEHMRAMPTQSKDTTFGSSVVLGDGTSGARHAQASPHKQPTAYDPARRAEGVHEPTLDKLTLFTSQIDIDDAARRGMPHAQASPHKQPTAYDAARRSEGVHEPTLDKHTLFTSQIDISDALGGRVSPHPSKRLAEYDPSLRADMVHEPTLDKRTLFTSQIDISDDTHFDGGARRPADGSAKTALFHSRSARADNAAAEPPPKAPAPAFQSQITMEDRLSPPPPGAGAGPPKRHLQSSLSLYHADDDAGSEAGSEVGSSLLGGIARSGRSLAATSALGQEAQTLERLRARMMVKGPKAYASLARELRSGAAARSPAELRAAVAAVGVDPGGAEDADAAFAGLARDYGGGVSCDALLAALRDPLPASREAGVRALFERLDTTAAGSVDPNAVIRAHCPDKHPEVVGGRMAVKEAEAEFYGTFHVGEVIEGKVTLVELLEYFQNVAAAWGGAGDPRCDRWIAQGFSGPGRRDAAAAAKKTAARPARENVIEHGRGPAEPDVRGFDSNGLPVYGVDNPGRGRRKHEGAYRSSLSLGWD